MCHGMQQTCEHRSCVHSRSARVSQLTTGHAIDGRAARPRLRDAIAATPLVVECDAADVETVRDWFATRDERCRWNVVDVRAAGSEELGFVPGRFLFAGCPLLAAMAFRVRAAAAAPGSRAIDVGSGSGRDAALLCCQYGFDFVCALDRDGRALSRWARLLDRHQVAPESRVAVEATIRAEGDLTAVVGPLGRTVHVARFLKREVLRSSRLYPRRAASCCTIRSSKTPRHRRMRSRRTSSGARFFARILRDDVEAIPRASRRFCGAVPPRVL